MLSFQSSDWNGGSCEIEPRLLNIFFIGNAAENVRFGLMLIPMQTAVIQADNDNV